MPWIEGNGLRRMDRDWKSGGHNNKSARCIFAISVFAAWWSKFLSGRILRAWQVPYRGGAGALLIASLIEQIS